MNSGNPIHWTDPITRRWIVYVWLAMFAVMRPEWAYALERWGEEDYLLVDRESDVKNCSLTTYTCRDNRMVLENYNEVC
jgi:hypothetical protein